MVCKDLRIEVVDREEPRPAFRADEAQGSVEPLDGLALRKMLDVVPFILKTAVYNRKGAKTAKQRKGTP